ncbi:MAG: hypothetical protein M3Z24_02835 [Chloroflexota bacterium]|nr:hypothetical protein [Chloroflexota bacterium]
MFFSTPFGQLVGVDAARDVATSRFGQRFVYHCYDSFPHSKCSDIPGGCRPGRGAAIAGLDMFTEWKVMYTDFSGKLKAQIDE